MLAQLFSPPFQKTKIAALSLSLLILAGGLWFGSALNHPPLPNYGQTPDFTLTERNGHVLTLHDLLGKVWVADFIFTRCGGQCPIMSKQMSSLHLELARIGYLKKKFKNVLFVSFTVDPEYDTPSILADYAKGYNANPDRWFFLTGKRDMLDTVSTGFKMSPLGDPMNHSTRFILMDKDANIRGYYDGTNAEAMEKLKEDISRLL